jgi:hypothetical protein
MPSAGIDDIQRQKMIGDLTQALMRKLPQEQRRGYMLQPKQYMDWNRFNEQLWEFEGVTAEMLRRQRAQTELMQSLLGLADDPKALDLALGLALFPRPISRALANGTSLPAPTAVTWPPTNTPKLPRR